MKNTEISKAIKVAMGIGAFAMVMPFSGYAFAQDDSAEEQVEEVIVTGSRIKRSVGADSQTVITISAEDMKVAGSVSVADALRTSNLNSLGSFRESSGSSAQSNATLDLRGAGPSRSLILINGRRVVGSPSLGGGGSVNLNMIPFSFVEEIQILADGASAVYGSDAVAGVVNIIMKSGYDGMRFTASHGERSKDDGGEQSFSLMIGSTGDRSSVTFGIEHDSRDEIYDADRSYTAASWGDQDGDGQIMGYGETAGVSFYGYTLINPTYTGADFDPNDDTTWYVHPGSNCADDGSFAGVMQSDLVFGPDTGYYCGYAYANVSANRASLERTHAFVSSSFEVSDDMTVYADAILANNESFGRYAPPAAPGTALASDPRNPFGQDVPGYFRWVDIGTRDNIVNDTFVDVNLGVKGTLTDDLSYDIYYTNSDYRSASIGMYYLSYGGFAENILEEVTDYETYVNNLKSTTLNDDRMNIQKITAGLQWDMFEMDGGQAYSYFGAETWDVDYSALVDAQSEAGLVGGSAGNSATGQRSVSAVSAETILPFTDWLEIQAAVRFDDYDDFGKATSPRIGATITAIEDVTIKMSYGEGFRAPDLSDLYGATSFSAENAYDYLGCQIQGVAEADCPQRQFDTYIGSNPELGAEESESLSFGVEWAFMPDWDVSVNYFDMTVSNSIEYVSAQDMLNVDFNLNGNNPAVTRNASGGVTRIDAGYQNAITDLNFEAVDVVLRGAIETDEFGTFYPGFQATNYLNFDSETVFGSGEVTNAVGLLGLPEWMSYASVSWVMGDWSASISADYTGEQESSSGETKYKGYTTTNARIGYDFGDMGSVTISANNLGNKDPLLDSSGANANEYMYSQVGRVIYFSYSIEM